MSETEGRVCDHARSITRDGYRKWCNDCRAPLPLTETEAAAIQSEVETLRRRVAYMDKWADLLDLIPGETFSAETIANALRTGRLPKVAPMNNDTPRTYEGFTLHELKRVPHIIPVPDLIAHIEELHAEIKRAERKRDRAEARLDALAANLGEQGGVWEVFAGADGHPAIRRVPGRPTYEELQAEIERLSKHRCQHCGRTWERDSNIYDECGDCFREHQALRPEDGGRCALRLRWSAMNGQGASP